MSAPTPARGTRVGPYELLSLIGSGGMGEVWKARDTRLERIVAVKFFRQQFSMRSGVEARAIAALNHPHIATLHDVGPDFLVMEYVEGEPIRGPMSLDKFIAYAIQICEALEAAREKGITHRDLKPANILMTRQGIKLIDFGLARIECAISDETLALSLATPGVVVGTLHYLSPEQLEGKAADHRSDIFSLGCVLYEIYTGKRPFDGDSAQAVASAIIGRDPAPFPPGTPHLLERIVRTCIAKNPDSRWQTAGELRHALGWSLDPDAGGAAHASQRQRRAWLPWALAFALAASAIIAVLAALGPARAARHNAHFEIEGGSGSILDLAISPDGKKLAFTAPDPADAQVYIWLRGIDGLSRRRLERTERAAIPLWSPDGKYLYFRARRRVMRIASSGGIPEVVADGFSGQHLFAPDGTLYGLAAGVPHRMPFGGAPEPAFPDIEKRHKLEGFRIATFLPGGRPLFVFNRASDRGIFMADENGVRTVVPGGASAAWAPSRSGKHGYLIVRMSSAELVAIPFDPAAVRPLGDPVRLAENVVAFSASPSGALAYQTTETSAPSRRRRTWFDRKGRVVVEMPWAAHAELSPDGKRLVFDSPDETGRYQIFLSDAFRDTAERVTPGRLTEWRPIWTHDGSGILFTSALSGADRSILLRKLSSGTKDEVVLESPEAKLHIEPSSDGRYLVYESSTPRSAGSGISYIDLKDPARTPRPLLASEFNESQPKLSPDGHWLAYVSDETERNEVYVQRFPDGGAKQRVSTGGGVSPRWGAGGKEIYYLAPDQKLMVVSAGETNRTLAAGPPKILFQTAVAEAGASTTHFTSSPDGQRFLAPTGESQSAGRRSFVITDWRQ